MIIVFDSMIIVFDSTYVILGILSLFYVNYEKTIINVKLPKMANWKYSARAHIALISRIKALLMHSHCAPERIISVSAFISRSPRSYCGTIALLLHSERKESGK